MASIVSGVTQESDDSGPESEIASDDSPESEVDSDDSPPKSEVVTADRNWESVVASDDNPESEDPVELVRLWRLLDKTAATPGCAAVNGCNDGDVWAFDTAIAVIGFIEDVIGTDGAGTELNDAVILGKLAVDNVDEDVNGLDEAANGLDTAVDWNCILSWAFVPGYEVVIGVDEAVVIVDPVVMGVFEAVIGDDEAVTGVVEAINEGEFFILNLFLLPTAAEWSAEKWFSTICKFVVEAVAAAVEAMIIATIDSSYSTVGSGCGNLKEGEDKKTILHLCA